MKAAFRKNRKHYLQESLGLAIFMISACFFGAMLFAEKSVWRLAIPNDMLRNVLMGIAMGSTAVFIFYSPWTAPSGSQINPAVTLTFLRLGKMCRYDALFFVLAQLIGGTAAVWIMQWLMGDILTSPPVYSVATLPGKTGTGWVIITELLIAFITMSVVLFTSQQGKLKKYTRVFASCLVCAWVILAGPVSGFGMNPARSLASALPSGIWISFWIYLLVPFAGMLLAAELYLFIKRNGVRHHHPNGNTTRRKPSFKPLEFMV